MPNINHILPPRVHIPIRNRVAQILADEMFNQAALTYDDDLLLPFYIQRSKPVTPDECPVAVVSLNDGGFGNQTVEKSDGSFEVFVDVYEQAFSTEEFHGDTLASFGAHKIAGFVMGILESPIYKTLGFAPPFIRSVHVTGFESGEVARNDATSLSVVRVKLEVSAVQSETLIVPSLIAGNDTRVTLNQTAKGFAWTFNSF